MNKHKFGLTGEGFSIEEANELLEGYKPQPMTEEERAEYLTKLECFAARAKAERDEDAAIGEFNGPPVTREDLDREMAKQRGQVNGAHTEETLKPQSAQRTPS